MAEPKKAEKKPKKKKVRKFRLKLKEQYKDFSDQDNARTALIKILQTEEVYFCSLDKVFVEKD